MEPMSLQPQAIPPVPEETARVARASSPKGNIYIQMRDEFGTFFRDEDFLDLFSEKGQPAESAWRLALVMVMQYAEGLTDRQAADAASRVPPFRCSALLLSRTRMGKRARKTKNRFNPCSGSYSSSQPP